MHLVGWASFDSGGRVLEPFEPRPGRSAAHALGTLCYLCFRVGPEKMVGLGGLEPPTSPLSGARSSHLSYRPGKHTWQELTTDLFYDGRGRAATEDMNADAFQAV
jgi:hypothetical protein